MSKYLKLFFVALSLCVGAAWAGDYEDATAALDRRDYPTALTKFKRAAEKNDSNAQLNLGNMYHNGRGVVQDYAEAVRWYKLAAAEGNDGTKYNLAFMYEYGTGVAQDYVRAHIWWNLAAVTGNAIAVQNRDIVAKQMTLQQITEAQKLARECQARNFKNCD